MGFDEKKAQEVIAKIDKQEYKKALEGDEAYDLFLTSLLQRMDEKATKYAKLEIGRMTRKALGG